MAGDERQLHVIFGAAALGQAVMRAALARGHRVRLVSRGGKAQVPAGVEVTRGDAKDPSSTREVCRGAAVVYNCAAPPYTDWPAQYPPIQAGIVEGAAAAGARLVSAENVYPYGKVSGPMTEDTPIHPCTKKGEVRARLNEELLAAHRAGKVKVALGRGPDFYGPAATVNTNYGDRVFRSALAGKAVDIFGDPDALHTWIYVDDFGRGLVTLGEREEALGKWWHLPCAPPVRQRELLGMIYEEAGQPLKFRSMPGFLATAVGWFVPIMRELAEMNYQWTSDYVFNHDKFDRAFGKEVTPHEQAVKETVAWFRAHPSQGG